MIMLKESQTPLIGIFYIVKGKVYANSVPYTEHAVGKEFLHHYFWGQLKQILNMDKVPMDYYPRGRVDQNSMTNTFDIEIAPIDRTAQNIQLIKNEFNLVGHPTKIYTSSEYEGRATMA